MTEFRRQRIRESLKHEQMDACLATTIENVYYLSGFSSTSKRMSPATRIFALQLPGEAQPWMVLPVCDLPSAHEAGVALGRVISYGDFYFAYTDAEPGPCTCSAVRSAVAERKKNAWEALSCLLNRYAAGVQKIGIEYAGLYGEDLWRILKENASFHFCDGSAALYRARMQKGPEEIRALEQAAEIAEQAVLKTFHQLKEGDSEHDAARRYLQHIMSKGASPTFAVFTFGARSAFVDTSARDENRLQKGDMIRADVGCCIEGYQADMSRTAVFGKPNNRLLSAFKAIYEGERRAIEAAAPNLPASEIFRTAVAETRSAGLSGYRRAHCGHGLGLEISEPPNIREDVDQPLLPGMVLCVETPYYQVGWGGVQVEDTLLITDSGHRMLTKTSADLVLL